VDLNSAFIALPDIEKLKLSVGCETYSTSTPLLFASGTLNEILDEHEPASSVA